MSTLCCFPAIWFQVTRRGEPAQFESQLRVWLKAMKPLYDDDIGVYVCRGNHEIADAWGADGGSHLDPNNNFTTRWLDVFGNDLYPKHILPDNGPIGEKYMTYSVKHKNALVVLLDQYAGIEHRAVHKINQQWIDDQLATKRQPAYLRCRARAGFQSVAHRLPRQLPVRA